MELVGASISIRSQNAYSNVKFDRDSSWQEVNEWQIEIKVELFHAEGQKCWKIQKKTTNINQNGANKIALQK